MAGSFAAASAFGGMLTLLVVLFVEGGWVKSEAFSVIRAIFSGERGDGPRFAMFLGLFLLFVFPWVIGLGVFIWRKVRPQ